MKRLILIIGLFLGVKLPAQTISTSTVFWTTGGCSICGPTIGNYACQSGSGSGNWNAGTRTFLDPSPAGHTICAIQVVVNKVDCGLTNLCVSLNGALIQCIPTPLGTNCNCGACWPQTFQRQTCPFPNYVKGGINSLVLNPTGNLCVNSAVITVYSNPDCSGLCLFIPLPIEKDTTTIKLTLPATRPFIPKISNITDLYGNNYDTISPKDFKGILIIRYENGDFKKMLKI